MTNEATPVLRQVTGEQQFSLPVSLTGELRRSDLDPQTADGAPYDANALARWIRVTRGTHLILLLEYDDSLTVSADCKVIVYGRGGPAERDFTPLYDSGSTTDPIAYQCPDSNGDLISELTTDTTNDIRDGTLKMTVPKRFDLLGAYEFCIAVHTALNGTGTLTNSNFLYKMI